MPFSVLTLQWCTMGTLPFPADKQRLAPSVSRPDTRSLGLCDATLNSVTSEHQSVLTDRVPLCSCHGCCRFRGYIPENQIHKPKFIPACISASATRGLSETRVNKTLSSLITKYIPTHVESTLTPAGGQKIHFKLPICQKTKTKVCWLSDLLQSTFD